MDINLSFAGQRHGTRVLSTRLFGSASPTRQPKHLGDLLIGVSRPGRQNVDVEFGADRLEC